MLEVSDLRLSLLSVPRNTEFGVGWLGRRRRDILKLVLSANASGACGCFIGLAASFALTVAGSLLFEVHAGDRQHSPSGMAMSGAFVACYSPP